MPLYRTILLKISHVSLTPMVKESIKIRVKLETIHSLPLHKCQIALGAQFRDSQ